MVRAYLALKGEVSIGVLAGFNALLAYFIDYWKNDKFTATAASAIGSW